MLIKHIILNRSINNSKSLLIQTKYNVIKQNRTCKTILYYGIKITHF